MIKIVKLISLIIVFALSLSVFNNIAANKKRKHMAKLLNNP